jgi:hypothetical protein
MAIREIIEAHNARYLAQQSEHMLSVDQREEYETEVSRAVANFNEIVNQRPSVWERGASTTFKAIDIGEREIEGRPSRVFVQLTEHQLGGHAERVEHPWEAKYVIEFFQPRPFVEATDQTLAFFHEENGRPIGDPLTLDTTDMPLISTLKNAKQFNACLLELEDLLASGVAV